MSDETDGRTVDSSMRFLEHRLDRLLARVTPYNRHAEVDVGKPVGREAFDWHCEARAKQRV